MDWASYRTEWQVTWQTGTILEIQTGLNGSVGWTPWLLILLLRSIFPRFVAFPPCDFTSWIYQVSTRKCFSVKWYFPSPKTGNTLPGRLFTSPASPRERQCVTERFGSRSTSKDMLAGTWRVIFSTMAGGCLSARWNLSQVISFFLPRAFLYDVTDPKPSDGGLVAVSSQFCGSSSPFLCTRFLWFRVSPTRRKPSTGASITKWCSVKSRFLYLGFYACKISNTRPIQSRRLTLSPKPIVLTFQIYVD